MSTVNWELNQKWSETTDIKKQFQIQLLKEHFYYVENGAYHWLKSLKESRHKNPIKEQQKSLSAKKFFISNYCCFFEFDPSTDDFIDSKTLFSLMKI